MGTNWKEYRVGGLYDELMQGAGRARPAARPLTRYLASLGAGEIGNLQTAA